MTIPSFYIQATDPLFRLLAGYTSPPKVGQITSIEASGQVRVSLDDPDGGTALAWPLNGFTYAVDDIVYVLFAADHPESAIVLGSRSPIPTLDADVLDETFLTNAEIDATYLTEVEAAALYLSQAAAAATYLAQDGSDPLTGDWDIGNSRAIKGDKLQARDADGLTLQDDGGNVGVFIKDGGNVGIGTSSNVNNPLSFYSQSNTHPFGMDRDTNLRSSAFQWLTNGSNEWLFGERNQGDSNLHLYSYSVGADVLRVLLSSGFFGFGSNVTPQGLLHAHDGTAGCLFVSKTNINGTAQTLIPNGTGDVTLGILGFHVTFNGSAASAGVLGPIAVSANQNIVIGSDTYQYAVSATGAFTVQRTAGSNAGTCALLLLWL